MATAKEQLLSMMSPQQARLMDQQLRDQQVAQRSQGAGMLSGLVQAYTGMADTAQRATGIMPMGSTEMGARRQQAEQQQMTQAIQGAQGKDRIAKLRDTAAKLRATGNLRAIMMADQYDMQADELAYKAGMLTVNQIKAMNTGKGSQGVTSTEGEHFRDEAGNIYATVLTTDKSTGNVEAKYVNLTGGPEYDGKSKLVPVIKSGEFSGMSPLEASELRAVREGKIQESKDFNVMRVEAAKDYSEAKSLHSNLIRALELTKEAAESGQLEGGVQAALQNAWFKVTGSTPKNIAELNQIFGESTYQRLKPLFGGVISEGERKAVEDLYMNIGKSGATNTALLNSLIGKANGAMFNYNVLMSSKSYEDYIGKLTAADVIPEETKTTDKPRRRRWNPETNTFEDI